MTEGFPRSTVLGRAWGPPFFLPMQIRILFFASYRDLVGTGDMALDLPHGSSVAGMVAELRARGEPFTKLPPHLVVAVNQEYASEHRTLGDGDVVAFIPPVAGG